MAKKYSRKHFTFNCDYLTINNLNVVRLLFVNLIMFNVILKDFETYFHSEQRKLLYFIYENILNIYFKTYFNDKENITKKTKKNINNTFNVMQFNIMGVVKKEHCPLYIVTFLAHLKKIHNNIIFILTYFTLFYLCRTTNIFTILLI